MPLEVMGRLWAQPCSVLQLGPSLLVFQIPLMLD